MSDRLRWGATAPPHSETVDLIARFASDWPAIPLERGQVLFIEGDRPDFLYLVKSGAPPRSLVGGPHIFMTGYPDLADKEIALRGPLFVKPVDWPRLIEEIEIQLHPVSFPPPLLGE